MFTSLDVFKTAQAMAAHAGQRQTIVAQNVAHADTPGYKARDLPNFADLLRGADVTSAARATRPAHLFGHTDIVDARAVDSRAEPSANGNTVSIEAQMVQATDIKRQHDRALAIYRSSLVLLRTALGRQS